MIMHFHVSEECTSFLREHRDVLVSFQLGIFAGEPGKSRDAGKFFSGPDYLRK